MKRRFVSIASILAIVFSLFSPPLFAADTSRSSVDRPDDFSGFQIHYVYVVPSDANDEFRDTNNLINSTIVEAQQWLQRTLGRQLVIDTYQQKADVTFLKSKYKVSELCYGGDCQTLSKLIDELRAQDPNLSAKKTYYFEISGVLDTNSCGWATYNSNLSLGFNLGVTCNNSQSQASAGLSYPAKTFIHEIFHTFGVNHVCQNNSDLMIGSPECNIDVNTFNRVSTTVDSTHSHYFGGELAGVDISKLPVWTDKSKATNSTITPNSGSKYLYTLQDGTPFIRVGTTNQKFSWTWSKNISRNFQEMECRLYVDGETITGSSDETTCLFDIPINLNIGAKFKVTSDFYVGPFHGEAVAEGVVVRKDYTRTLCTVSACVVGGTVSRSLCWSNGTKGVEVQTLLQGKWTTYRKADLVTENSRCSNDSEYPLEYRIDISSTEKGMSYFRWHLPATKSQNEYKSVPFAVIVRDPKTPEPSEEEIINADQEAILAGNEADLLSLQKTILCIKKGSPKRQKQVTGLRPWCPAGYVVKK